MIMLKLIAKKIYWVMTAWR